MGNIGGFSISYSVRGGPTDELALQKMSVAFDRAGADFSRFGEFVFPELVPVLESASRRQFDAEGRGPNRGAWAALTPRYAERKRRIYGSKPILEASGRLRQALTEESSPYAARAYTATQFAYGTAGVPYASFHQSGTGRMVDRPLFDFGGDVENDINATARRVARQVALGNLGDFVTVAP